MKVIGFEIHSDYGHFRKHYTNMTAMSFLLPPRTAIVGMIGAIIGVDRSVLYDTFAPDNCFISIVPKSKLESTIIMQNYLRGWYGEKPENKNPTNIELIKNPSYRIYFNHNDEEINKKLFDNLTNHTSIYTPYMGNNRHVANFGNITYGELNEVRCENIISIDSAIRFDNVQEINFNDCYIHRDKMCSHMTNNKIPLDYTQYIYSTNNMKISCSLKQDAKCYQINGDIIMEV